MRARISFFRALGFAYPSEKEVKAFGGTMLDVYYAVEEARLRYAVIVGIIALVVAIAACFISPVVHYINAIATLIFLRFAAELFMDWIDYGPKYRAKKNTIGIAILVAFVYLIYCLGLVLIWASSALSV